MPICIDSREKLQKFSDYELKDLRGTICPIPKILLPSCGQTSSLIPDILILSVKR